MIVLSLPTPPTANNLFFNSGKRRVKSKEYESWINHALWELKSQGPKPIEGPVTIEYEVEENNRRDCDNYAKPLNDVLVRAGVIKTDRMSVVRSVTVKAAWDVEGVRATISPTNI